MAVSDWKECFPKRWDHYPKKDRVECCVQFRELATTDVNQLLRFMKRYGSRRPSRKCWHRWCENGGWTVWVATRNAQTVVGVMAARRDYGSSTRVLAWGVAPGNLITRSDVFGKLLLLTAYECPELPVDIVVRDDDLQTQTRLKQIGLVPLEKTDVESHTFRHPPIVTFGHRPTDAVG